MDKIIDIVEKVSDSVKSAEQEQQSNKKEAIDQLFALRERAIKLADNAEKTLSKRRKELKEINEGICKVQGHTYTDWVEHPGFLDRSWYYTRECQICSKKEQTEIEPVEYRAQMLKKKKQGLPYKN